MNKHTRHRLTWRHAYTLCWLTGAFLGAIAVGNILSAPTLAAAPMSNVTVWVACSDGPTCATTPSSMNNQLVTHCDYYVAGGPCVPWTPGATPPSQHQFLPVNPDPGATR